MATNHHGYALPPHWKPQVSRRLMVSYCEDVGLDGPSWNPGGSSHAHVMTDHTDFDEN